MKILFELEDHEGWISPIKVADALINTGVEVETSSFEKALSKMDLKTIPMFDTNDLKEIAEYILVYCKYNVEEVEQ